MVESIVLECWEVAFGVVVFPCSMDLHPQCLWAMDTFQCMILPQVLNIIGNSDNGIGGFKREQCWQLGFSKLQLKKKNPNGPLGSNLKLLAFFFKG